MKHGGVVYILTNNYHTVYYTGVTADLLPRIIEHREKHYPKSFTARYNIFKLVYFEYTVQSRKPLVVKSKSRNTHEAKNSVSFNQLTLSKGICLRILRIGSSSPNF